MNRVPRSPQFIECGVPPDLAIDWYCPTCQSPLINRALHDPYCVGVVCAHGHRFQFPQRVVDGQWCELASQLPPVGSTEIACLLEVWVKRADYRGYLQSQVAAALCRVHDFELLGDRVPWEPAQVTFHFCPQCGEVLHDAPDQLDSHSLQIVCGQNHEYTLHGDLYFELSGKRVEMDRELADVPLISLCRGFGARNGPMARLVHVEIAAVFEAFARQHHAFWASEMEARGLPARA